MRFDISWWLDIGGSSSCGGRAARETRKAFSSSLPCEGKPCKTTSKVCTHTLRERGAAQCCVGEGREDRERAGWGPYMYGVFMDVRNG